MPRELRDRVLDVKVPWKHKVRLVVEGLADTSRKTAVLVDDPWLGSPEEAPSLFAERSIDLLDEIERSTTVSLVLSRSDRPLAGTFVELPTAGEPRTVLAPDRWQASSLQHVARQLAASGDPKLARLSPVEIRLAVVLASVKGMSASAALQRMKGGSHVFVRTVLDALGSARLRNAIIRLGVMLLEEPRGGPLGAWTIRSHALDGNEAMESVCAPHGAEEHLGLTALTDLALDLVASGASAIDGGGDRLEKSDGRVEDGRHSLREHRADLAQAHGAIGGHVASAWA